MLNGPYKPARPVGPIIPLPVFNFFAATRYRVGLVVCHLGWVDIRVGKSQPYPDRGSNSLCLLQSRLLQFDVTQAGGLLL